MYYFIVNYTGGSGRARKTWNEVHKNLKLKGVTYKAYVTKYKGHATRLAEKISSLDDDDIRIIVVGGDGSINEVLNGIRDFSKVKLGVIPTGSGNDFAKELCISSDPKEALEMILSSVGNRSIDLGKVITEEGLPQIFGISSGIGLDAIVCKKAIGSKVKRILNRIKLGKLTYLVLTVHNLFSMETYNVKVVMTLNNESKTETVNYKNLIFLAAMNFRCEGGGVPMNPNARPDDGFLSICAVSDIPKLKTFFLLPVLVAAKHGNKKGFELKNVKKLEFSADRPMVLHADGEYVGDVRQIEMEIIPDAIRVLT